MKSFLTILTCAALLASCKKKDGVAPTHVAPPCESNFGSANFTFTSDHYQLTQTHDLTGCEFMLTYKDHHWRPDYFRHSIAIQKDSSITMGVFWDRKFTLGNGIIGDTLWVAKEQMFFINRNIADADMYDYASNGRDGSYFIATDITDTTISGNFHVHMSRRRTFNNGNNMDMEDSSLLVGSFNNVKILWQHL